MSCNTTKYKELCMAKKGVTPNFPPLCGIEQSDSLTLLGVTLQNDCKFSSHVKKKLREANNCLYILISLRKDGWIHAGGDITSLRLLFCQRSKTHFQSMEPVR